MLLFLKAKVGFDELADCSHFFTQDFGDVVGGKGEGGGEGGVILYLLNVRRVRVECQYIGNNDEAQTDQSKSFFITIGKHFTWSVHAQCCCNPFPT